MLRMVLFLALASSALANTPKPPTDPSGYVVYLMVGLVTVIITTGGQFAVALLGHLKKEDKAAECKAGEKCPEPKPCYFGRNQNEQLAKVSMALHYTEDEGNERPVLSGHWRQQATERSQEQTKLLQRLVENSSRQTKALEDLNRNLSSPQGKKEDAA
jgi:hypothetical protein